MKHTRRSFLGIAAGLVGAVGCGDAPVKQSAPEPADKPSEPPPDAERVTISLADHPSFAESGLAVVPRTRTAPTLLLVRRDEGVRVFVNICTHASCPLAPKPAEERIYCDQNCGHGSIYSLDGEVITGPSIRPLYEFFAETSESSNTVVVILELKNA